LWAADSFVQLAREIEDRHTGRPEFNVLHRSFVVGAVLSAVAFLEAAINEFFLDAVEEHQSYVGPIPEPVHDALRAYWRESRGMGSFLEKYQIVRNLDEDVLLVGCTPFHLQQGGLPCDLWF